MYLILIKTGGPMAEYRFIKKLMMIAVLMPAASIAQVYTSNVTYGKPAETELNAKKKREKE